jgi:hypothetical protein
VARQAFLTYIAFHVALQNGIVRAAETRGPICAISGFVNSVQPGLRSGGTRVGEGEGWSLELGVVGLCNLLKGQICGGSWRETWSFAELRSGRQGIRVSSETHSWRFNLLVHHQVSRLVMGTGHFTHKVQGNDHVSVTE